MRSTPGMVVMCPADGAETKAMVKAAYEHDGPVYMRFSRFRMPAVHDGPVDFQIGHGEVLRDGTDVAIVANGLLVPEAVCSLLAEKYPTPVKRIGVNDEFRHSGPAGPLLKQFGLCADHISEVVRGMCK